MSCVPGVDSVGRGKERPNGDLYRSRALDLSFRFCRKPAWKLPYWVSRRRMPDCPFKFMVILEVERDETPSIYQEAAVVSIRRSQIEDTIVALPLIEHALRKSGRDVEVAADDLVLSDIRLPPHPLKCPVFDLFYRWRLEPKLLVGVGHKRAGAHSGSGKRALIGSAKR